MQAQLWQLASEIMSHPPRLQKLTTVQQRRLDELLDKNSEGTITDPEKRTLEKLVCKAEQLMVSNAKRLATFAKSAKPGSSAVPVTIWLQPQMAER